MTQYSGKIIRKTPVVPTQTSASGVWTTADAAAAVKNNTWPVPGVPDPISRSVRLRSSATAYFNRTFGTPTNEKIWTWSAWVKRGSLGVTASLFNASTGASPAYDGFRFNTSDQLQFFTGGAVTVNLVTTAVFRDPSAWYHIVLSYNATTTTVTIYVNGVAQTTTGTTVSNTTYSFNHASTLHSIGAQVVNGVYSAGTYFDGYLTEINFIDGQALTPSSFGTTNTLTGAWIPMPYTGTYGANGFYLNFKDNTSTTTLGYDYSGNSNNWTANNISLTSGTTYDSMLDVPTPWVGYNTGDTSAVTRGNYCVMNPVYVNSTGNPTVSDGNLTVLGQSYGKIGTVSVNSGKWYWEATCVSQYGSGYLQIGVADPTVQSVSSGPNPGVEYISSANKRQNGGSLTAYGATWVANDVIGVALDMDGGTITFYKNGVSQGTAYSGLSGNFAPYIGGSGGSNSNSMAFNFGQRPFSYSVPSGYKALCTTNLPTPTIPNGANYMAASLWTGNGSNPRAAVSGLAFQPDLVWTKTRNQVRNNVLFDSVRGAGSTKGLFSNATDAEGGGAGNETSNYGYISSFNTDGFTVTNGAINNNYFNTNSDTYVAWQWQAGAGTTSSNTSGTITSTVSVGATQGFSVVTFTSPASGSFTIGHGLGVVPSMIITKARGATNWWTTYHKSIGNTGSVALNSTLGTQTSSVYWGNTSPTSTVFTIGDAGTFDPSTTGVAYCFAEVAGFSAFGKYTGNGSSDGSFVYLGFRPRYVMIKRTDDVGDWWIYDSSRSTYNAAIQYLYADTSAAEVSDVNEGIDFLSNGFKLRVVGNYQPNTSGGTFIYAAFAENPFNYSNAR